MLFVFPQKRETVKKTWCFHKRVTVLNRQVRIYIYIYIDTRVIQSLRFTLNQMGALLERNLFGPKARAA